MTFVKDLCVKEFYEESSVEFRNNHGGLCLYTLMYMVNRGRNIRSSVDMRDPWSCRKSHWRGLAHSTHLSHVISIGRMSRKNSCCDYFDAYTSPRGYEFRIPRSWRSIDCEGSDDWSIYV